MKSGVSAAEEAFKDLPDHQSRETAKLLFQAITEKGPDNREVRSPRRLCEVAEITGVSEQRLKPVIECFRAPGRAFLMPPHRESLRSDRLIDISHESLIRQWERLAATHQALEYTANTVNA